MPRFPASFPSWVESRRTLLPFSTKLSVCLSVHSLQTGTHWFPLRARMSWGSQHLSQGWATDPGKLCAGRSPTTTPLSPVVTKSSPTFRTKQGFFPSLIPPIVIIYKCCRTSFFPPEGIIKCQSEKKMTLQRTLIPNMWQGTQQKWPFSS